ncbi:MAG: oligosaccharide flippase family protein [Proteobacteria bacterium]|nr:oligosaccharide flippase family protein [Pseudomonadota bacterium]
MTAAELRADLIYNYAGLAVLAASGIVLNFIVVWGWDEEALGVFNQVIAVYVVVAMLASGGLHAATLRAVAAHHDDAEEVANTASASVALSLASSVPVSLAFYLSSGIIADLFDSPAVGDGIRIITPGLLCFSINKVLIAIVNGLQHMRVFALVQGLRGALVVVCITGCWWQDAPSWQLPIVFTLTEVALFVLVLGYISTQVRLWRVPPASWLATHIWFCAKNFASGVLLELNGRIDVLMLGVYHSDALVGIYSFAALFAEGFFQLIVVLQNIYQPMVAVHAAQDDIEAVDAVVRTGRRLTYLIMLGTVPLALLLFPVATSIAGAGLSDSVLPFAILVLGMALAAGVLTFQNTLAMANLPGWHTIFMIGAVTANVAANAVLIPQFDIIGAAAATACSYLLAAALLTALTRKLVGARLF